ncbi:MAG: mechanosensitive ion channel family protein, partial [Methanobacteriota archaeon]
MVQHFWERVPYLIIALVVFIFFILLGKLFKFFMNKALSNRLQHKKNLTMVLNRIGGILIIFVGFMIALVVAIPGFKAGQLVSALGIGSVAIGFAFKDIFQNLLSGILILLGEPFRIGDSIIVNGMEGSLQGALLRVRPRERYVHGMQLHARGGKRDARLHVRAHHALHCCRLIAGQLSSDSSDCRCGCAGRIARHCCRSNQR